MSKSYCITINNYTIDEAEFLRDRFCYMCTRLVASREVGQDEGTAHIQAFMTLRRTATFKMMKKWFPRAHIEKAKASELQNWIYCTKPQEDGTCDIFIDFMSNFRGKRNDITDFCELIKTHGVKRSALDDPDVYVKYHKGLEKWEEIYHSSQIDHKADYTEFTRPFLELPDEGCFYVLWGASGIGKTEFACAHFKDPLKIEHIEDFKKYDPSRHDGIVIDDMEFDHIPRTACIHLTDQAKWRTLHMRYLNWVKPKHLKILLTTNNYEGRVFGDNSDDPAIKRRIKTFDMGKEPLY